MSYTWPKTVENIIHDVVDHNMHVGNKAKADIFVERLSKLNTTDEFYIMVYNDCGGYDKHCFKGTFNWYNGACICVFRRGKCNVVIYRSKKAYSASRLDIEDARVAVEKYRFGFIQSASRDGLQFSCEQIFNKANNCGFVGIISDHDLTIRHVSKHQWGPGWWNKGDAAIQGPEKKSITVIIGYE